MSPLNAATPALAVTRNGRRFDSAIVVGSHKSNSANSIDVQRFRAAFLARHHRLAPSLARVVAELAFIEVRR